MSFRTIAAIACAAVSLANAPAHAGGISASASITDLKYQVIDLTPGDGNAAGVISASYNSFNTWASDISSVFYPGGYSGINRTGSGLDLLPTTASVAGGFARSQLSAPTAAGDAIQNLFLNNSVQAQSPNVALDEDGSSNASSRYMIDLVVAPYTSLVITGHMEASAQFSPTAGHTDQAQLQTYAAFAGGILAGQNLPILSGSNHTPASFAQDFTLRFNNNGASSVSTYFYSYANVLGTERQSDPVPSIPEPSSYAMLAAGLALIGAIAHKRKQA